MSDREFERNSFFSNWKHVDTDSEDEEELSTTPQSLPEHDARRERVDRLRLIIRWSLQKYNREYSYLCDTMSISYNLDHCHDEQSMLNLIGRFLNEHHSGAAFHPVIKCLESELQKWASCRKDVIDTITTLIRKQAQKNQYPQWENFAFKFNPQGEAHGKELEKLTQIFKMFNTVIIQEEDNDYLLLGFDMASKR